MVHTMPLTLLFALAVIVQPLAASAQEKPCPEVACRALGHFRTCNRTLDGAKVFSARVLAASRECSHNIFSVQVEDGKDSSLPAVVEIDLGPCVSFHGKVGDTTRIALVESPRPDMRRYHLACRIW